MVSLVPGSLARGLTTRLTVRELSCQDTTNTSIKGDLLSFPTTLRNLALFRVPRCATKLDRMLHCPCQTITAQIPIIVYPANWGHHIKQGLVTMFSQLERRKLLDQCSHLQQAVTHIDLLQLASQRLNDQDPVSWEQDLNDSSILRHLTVRRSSLVFCRRQYKVFNLLTHRPSSG